MVLADPAGISKRQNMTKGKVRVRVVGITWWLCAVSPWKPHIAAGSGLLIIVIRRSMFCFAIPRPPLSLLFADANTHIHYYFPKSFWVFHCIPDKSDNFTLYLFKFSIIYICMFTVLATSILICGSQSGVALIMSKRD